MEWFRLTRSQLIPKLSRAGFCAGRFPCQEAAVKSLRRPVISDASAGDRASVKKKFSDSSSSLFTFVGSVRNPGYVIIIDLIFKSSGWELSQLGAGTCKACAKPKPP
jgi:hypothetical protein